MAFRRPMAAAAAAAAAMLSRAHAASPQASATDAPKEAAVWKFGYGSNMSQDFLRKKKALNPLDSRRTVIRGFSLSFPEGRGIDLVEPTFATLKRQPDGEVHGVSTLLSRSDADKLDQQERTYNIEVANARVYGTGDELAVEVYVPSRPLSPDHPEGACSARYRDVLVRGAVENDLEPRWVAKLRALPTYTPSEETLDRRAALPSPSALPSMSIAELARHDGSTEGLPVLTSACGYIFEHVPIFRVYRGRDITQRNLLHHRGINLDENDDRGRSPFPRLSALSPVELEYVLQNRDRLIAKSPPPVAVLREFWEEQDAELDGVFRDNAMSRLGGGERGGGVAA